MRIHYIISALILASAAPLLPQASPSASQDALHLVVGGGFSDFYSEWSGRLNGPTVWADMNFHLGPSLLNGLGIELEGRDLNYGRTGNAPKLRQDTMLVGPIYTWQHYRRLHPFGEFFVGRGSMDFNPIPGGFGGRSHVTRTIYAVSTGGEYRVLGNVWVRGDFQYQVWPNMLHSHALNPDGFTVGAAYDLGGLHLHRH